MITPSKHENLNKSIVVLGGDIINKIKKTSYGIENLYHELYAVKSIDIRSFYDTLLFLWLADVINLDEHRVSLKHDSEVS